MINKLSLFCFHLTLNYLDLSYFMLNVPIFLGQSTVEIANRIWLIVNLVSASNKFLSIGILSHGIIAMLNISKKFGKNLESNSIN